MNKITFLKNLTLCLTWIIAKNAVYVYIFGHTLLQISHVKQTSIVFFAGGMSTNNLLCT